MIKGPKTASDWGEVILQIKNEVLLTKRRVHAGLVNTTSVSYTEVLSTFFLRLGLKLLLANRIQKVCGHCKCPV